MKIQQILAILAMMVATMTGSAIAAEAKEVTYKATMTGITCAGCEASVTASFKKLDGVQSVEFAAGEKEGTQVVTVKSSKSGLTKEQAVKALGKSATQYVVKDWKQAGDQQAG
jgi:copper chaperone CopZ